VPETTVVDQLVIETAWYGSVTQLWHAPGKDVTNVVQKCVQNGTTLYMNPGKRERYFATLFGDPCPGMTKTLAVRYQYGDSDVMELLPATRLQKEAYSVIIAPTITDPVAVKVNASLLVSLQVFAQEDDELRLVCKSSLVGTVLATVNVKQSMPFKEVRQTIADTIKQPLQCIRFFSPDGMLVAEDEDESRVDEVCRSRT